MLLPLYREGKDRFLQWGIAFFGHIHHSCANDARGAKRIIAGNAGMARNEYGAGYLIYRASRRADCTARLDAIWRDWQITSRQPLCGYPPPPPNWRGKGKHRPRP